MTRQRRPTGHGGVEGTSNLDETIIETPTRGLYLSKDLMKEKEELTGFSAQSIQVETSVKARAYLVASRTGRKLKLRCLRYLVV